MFIGSFPTKLSTLLRHEEEQMTSLVVQVFAAVLMSNFLEWLIHKYVLHGLGKRRKSLFNSHWHQHHKEVRKSRGYDRSYDDLGSIYAEGTRELLGIVVLVATQIPTFFIFPVYAGTTIFMALIYYVLHRKSHLDPLWARKNLTWHYDHHLGPNQDANWCVTFPLFDYILGTRVKYAGTEREKLDIEKKLSKEACRVGLPERNLT